MIERAVLFSQGKTLRIDGASFQLFSEDSMEYQVSALAEVEKQHITKILEKTNWMIHGDKGAAKLLDINPSTLRSRMKKLGIEKPA